MDINKLIGKERPNAIEELLDANLIPVIEWEDGTRTTIGSKIVILRIKNNKVIGALEVG